MVFYFSTIPPLVEKREVYTMEATLGCPRCSGRRIIKNGWLRGEQRYRCKDCCYNFVDPPKPDRPLVKKVLAILLYNLGLSFRATGKLCGVSGTTVLNWVDDFAEQHATKPATINVVKTDVRGAGKDAPHRRVHGIAADQH